MIGNYTASLEKHLADDDPLVEDVHRIRDAAATATQLTRQPLLFGRRRPASRSISRGSSTTC
ncbi:MAG: hypothetical protein FJW88_04300 [Actinobacteria bacterium]|nr:hypothetical protein [Actinomycetota bacterium]